MPTEATEIEMIVAGHQVFRGLDAGFIKTLAACARERRFAEGSYLMHEGAPADAFFLIRGGRVALEIGGPGHAPKIFSTLGPGEIVGLSWLAPPYRWSFDARALAPLTVISFDAKSLRDRCEAEPRLGYALMKRLFAIMIPRLHATRLQMLDVYGKPGR